MMGHYSNKLSDWPKMPSTEFYTDWLTEWLTNWCLQTSITWKWLRLHTTIQCCLRGVFWHTAIHTMHSSWTYQCPPLYSIHLFCQQKVSIQWLHVMTSSLQQKIFCIFHTNIYSILQGLWRITSLDSQVPKSFLMFHQNYCFIYIIAIKKPLLFVASCRYQQVRIEKYLKSNCVNEVARLHFISKGV